MAILDWLFGPGSEPGEKARESGRSGDTDTVRRIVAELNRLEPERARHLAAFAYVLSRVAGADLNICDLETQQMEELLQKHGQLSEEHALLIVEIAKNQNRLFGGTENFLVTREFKKIATEKQRCEILDCLFAVSAADDAVTGEEENQIWQIASELGISHRDFVEARLAYSDKRTVLRKKPE